LSCNKIYPALLSPEVSHNVHEWKIIVGRKFRSNPHKCLLDVK